jgi:hypothetical protein
MQKMKIFISSVQSEFAEERRTLKDFIQGNVLLRKFFTVFVFEDTPAEDRHPDSVYLREVDSCTIYLGLFGARYGRVNDESFSATHLELKEATKLNKARGGFLLTFKRKSNMTPQVTQQVPSKMAVHDRTELSSFQNRLILILTGEKSRTELMTILNLRDRNSFTNNYLDPSLASGYIQMTIPESPKSSKQKYSLTDLGRRVKDEFIGHDIGHDTGHDNTQVLDRIQQNIMSLISVMNGEMSRSEMMTTLGVTRRETFYKNYLKPSIEKSLLEMTLPDSPRSRKQKYRLTNPGLRMQKKLKAEK